MNELLKKLGVDGIESTEFNGWSKYEFPDSEAYAKAYSALDNDQDLDNDSEARDINELSMITKYSSDDFDIKLEADLKNDKYYLFIRGDNND